MLNFVRHVGMCKLVFNLLVLVRTTRAFHFLEVQSRDADDDVPSQMHYTLKNLTGSIVDNRTEDGNDGRISSLLSKIFSKLEALRIKMKDYVKKLPYTLQNRTKLRKNIR